MNNLYRELAPVTDVAWAEIELEAWALELRSGGVVETAAA